MRVRSLVVAFAVSGLASFAQAQVQESTAANPPTALTATTAPTIGVIDIGHILKNHPGYKAKMDGIKAQVEAADREMQAKRAGINRQMEEIKERYTEGTQEYAEAEKVVTDQDSKFRFELMEKRKAIEQAQAGVLYEAHTQISQLLDYLVKNHGFQVILQINRQKIDPEKPETLDMAMSQGVFFHNTNLDITDWVLSALQHQFNEAAATPSNQSTSPPTGSQPTGTARPR